MPGRFFFIQMFGHHPVGRQHEFLDQLMRHVVLRFYDVLNLTIGIHQDFRLRDVEIDASLLEPALAQ